MSSEADARPSAHSVEEWQRWNGTRAKTRPQAPDSAYPAYQYAFDPYGFWQRSTETAVRFWGSLTREMMPSEPALASWYQGIDAYTQTMQQTSQLLCDLLHPLHWRSASSDTAQMAQMLAALEERVYVLEDALIDIHADALNISSAGGEHVPRAETQEPALSTKSTMLENLAERLERIEHKMDRLLTTLEKIEK